MALTTLDPRTALIVIDLQKGIVAAPTEPYPADEVIARSAELVAAFRRVGLPIVLVNVAGGAPGRVEQTRRSGDMPSDWTELVPAIGGLPGDIHVTKRTWGAFTGTELEARLKTGGVTQVVLAGVATSIGVESTARQAHELGFNVALAVDAMSDRKTEAHRNSVENIFPRLGETARTVDIVSMLDRRESA